MKTKSLLVLPIILAGVIGIASCSQQNGTGTSTTNNSQRTSSSPQRPGSNTAGPVAQRVPAYYETAPSASNLMTTLPPERFPGQAREAYQVAKEIPQALAQLPCYCHCDQSMGHKSLHSCFEDEHASMCAVCVNEALTASQLQKQGLTPAQIRDRVIAQYSKL